MKTTDLEQQIINSENFDEKLVADNPAPEFREYIEQLMNERNIKRTDLIRTLNMDRTYGYQLLNGTRIPTKNQIIHIALYLGITTEQTQRLLHICSREGLYARNIEDARVMYALEHGYTYERAVNFVFTE